VIDHGPADHERVVSQTHNGRSVEDGSDPFLQKGWTVGMADCGTVIPIGRRMAECSTGQRRQVDALSHSADSLPHISTPLLTSGEH